MLAHPNNMRPANQQQSVQHMEHLLNSKIPGGRRTKVREHTQRAKRIATIIWARFQVGPYQYQLKHLIWCRRTQTQYLNPSTRYRHCLTHRYIVRALCMQARCLVEGVIRILVDANTKNLTICYRQWLSLPSTHWG